MSSNDLHGVSEAESTASHVMTTQERAFFDGVITPHLDGVRASMAEYLTKEFVSISAEVARVREWMKTQAALLRGELLTRVEDKIATCLVSLPHPSRAEPPLLHDVSFSGEPQHLDSFLYSIYDPLAAHSAVFVDDGRRIKWISRHFQPVGSPAADWWLSLVAENAVLFDSVISEGKTAAFPFRLPSLLSNDSFIDELVTNFADPFAAQKALKALQEFSMGRLGVQQFNVKFNSLLYRVKGLVELVLMDYYQQALSDRVRRQAMG